MGWEREKEREIGRETERETQRERQIMQYKKVDERGREREGNYRRKKTYNEDGWRWYSNFIDEYQVQNW